MKILFWNLHGMDNSKYIQQLIDENGIDIALFSEYSKVNFDEICNECSGYVFEEGMGGCEKIRMVHKDTINMVINREETRYAMFSFVVNSKRFIITGIHLPANPHATVNDRKHVISELRPDLEELEKQLDTYKTIIIGDFNASPFDSELVQKDMMNAVLFKELIKKREFDKYESKRYRRLYNPMLDCLSESTKMYGSFHYSSSLSTIHWFCYDQVLVRKELIDCLGKIEFCKSIGNENLLTRDGYPSKKISDHLPLLVEVFIDE